MQRSRKVCLFVCLCVCLFQYARNNPMFYVDEESCVEMGRWLMMQEEKGDKREPYYWKEGYWLYWVVLCSSGGYIQVLTTKTCEWPPWKQDLCRCNQIKILSYWIRWTLNPITSVLQGCEDTGTHRGECHVTQEAEIGTMHLNPGSTIHSQQPLGPNKKQGMILSQSLQKEYGPATTVSSDS